MVRLFLYAHVCSAHTEAEGLTFRLGPLVVAAGCRSGLSGTRCGNSLTEGNKIEVFILNEQ